MKFSLAILATITSFYSLFTIPAFAQEITPTSTPTPTPIAVKYDLPYPGTLPDNIIVYKLKVLRDKIEEFLIADPTKKIQFYLLQADKGILASAMLVDKHETALAQQTALKAENNYTLITNLLNSQAQKPDQELYKKLKLADLKHQEVLNGLIGKVSGKDKKTFETVLYFAKQNLQELEKIENTPNISEL